MKNRHPVIFIGAGPGDPGLLTIKGKKAIEEADVVIFAGTLVAPCIVAYAREGAEIYDSASLSLEETHAIAVSAWQGGKKTARVHSGDPSLYGAVREQTELLDACGIPWEIIPGVTAAFAAAALAGISFTNPEVGQTLIITRQAGRTPMPPAENLSALASHGSSMAIYLSGREAQTVERELLRCYPPHTPVCCAQRAGWPDGRIIWMRLDELAQTTLEQDLIRQSVFLILPGRSLAGKRSRLYSPDFMHGGRKREE